MLAAAVNIFLRAAVSETASSPATVVTVSASDADDPATNNNGVVVYSITGEQLSLSPGS